MSSGHFRHFWEHYLAPHPSREVRELWLSAAIRDFAVAMVMVFEPIYLYRVGFSAIAILGFYAVLYLFYFFLLPFGHKIAAKRGFEHAMVLASPFLILYYLSFFAVAWDWRFIFLALVTLVIQKILYWPSYHADFAVWHKNAESGREISNMSALLSLAAAFAPVVGGLVIATGGFPALFILVSVLIVVSNLPMLTTPEKATKAVVSYSQSLWRVFKPANRRHLLAFLGFGEEIVALVLWPIFIVLKVPDLLSIGAIVTMAMGVKLLVTLYVGGLVDEGVRMPVLRNGVMYTLGSWVIRPLVAGGLGVFLFDSFYRVAKNMTLVPMTAVIYDNAQQKDGIEYIVFFEMALALGKILACLIGMAIFWLLPNGWWLIFLMAGAMTLLYGLLPEDGDGFVK